MISSSVPACGELPPQADPLLNQMVDKEIRQGKKKRERMEEMEEREEKEGKEDRERKEEREEREEREGKEKRERKEEKHLQEEKKRRQEQLLWRRAGRLKMLRPQLEGKGWTKRRRVRVCRVWMQRWRLRWLQVRSRVKLSMKKLVKIGFHSFFLFTQSLCRV